VGGIAPAATLIWSKPFLNGRGDWCGEGGDLVGAGSWP